MAEMQNPGQFMAPAGGGGSAIVQAMARRGMVQGGSPLNQVGGGAPTAPQTPQIPQVPAGSPQGVPPTAQAPAPTPGPQGPQIAGPAGPSPASTEAQVIINALTKRLNDLSAMEKQRQAPPEPPAPAPAGPAIPPAPQGGLI